MAAKFQSLSYTDRDMAFQVPFEGWMDWLKAMRSDQEIRWAILIDAYNGTVFDQYRREKWNEIEAKGLIPRPR
jgi:hypothetical protein